MNRCEGRSVMKKVLLILALTSSPVWAQAPSATGQRGVAARVDTCTPIGKTAKGELVYSMKCEIAPAPSPTAAAPQAEVKNAPPPEEPEVRRSGLFGWSFDRR
jgi:hypothetical protein